MAVRYRIAVKGRISERLVGGFGTRLTLETCGGQSALTGDFADEAHLRVVLDGLCDFGIELVSVDVVR